MREGEEEEEEECWEARDAEELEPIPTTAASLALRLFEFWAAESCNERPFV